MKAVVNQNFPVGPTFVWHVRVYILRQQIQSFTAGLVLLLCWLEQMRR